MKNPRRRLADMTAETSPKLWLLDLDDTLFEASGGMLHEIHLRMNDFIMKRLGFDWATSDSLRRRYWEMYGTTFLGLWLHHQIDPREFLPAVHSFDFSPYVHVTGTPREALSGLPGRKVLYTNGPRPYAEALLAALNLKYFFDDVVTSTDMRIFGEWRPKPNASMLHSVCARHGVPTRSAVLVDDSPMNLKCAKGAGLSTVWCTGYRRMLHRRVLAYADHVISHIRELQKLSGSRSPKC